MPSTSRRRGRTPAWRAALAASGRACRAGGARIARAVRNRVRPWRPTICVDAERGDARRLRRALRRIALDYIRALAIAPPAALVVVVQRVVVQDGAELAALLQVFEDAGGRQRHVIFLALSACGREVEDDELPALLRHELQYALAGELGRLAFSAPLEPVRPRQPDPAPFAGRAHRDADGDLGPEPAGDGAFDYPGEPGNGHFAEGRVS